MIVDTSALFSILLREPDFPEILEAMAAPRGHISISAATLVEAHIVAQRSGLPHIEGQLRDLLDDQAVTIVPLSGEMAITAINAHRSFGRASGHPAQLNFGDCFAYALAKETGEPLLFKGNDFATTDIESVL